MTNKLYVGNFSDETMEDDLIYNFGELGTCISVKIIRNKHSGPSSGFAFVEMSIKEEAQKVIRNAKV
jgi:RNA recognition motif-containing protein